MFKNGTAILDAYDYPQLAGGNHDSEAGVMSKM